MAKYFRLFVVGILLSSCSVETIEEVSYSITPTFKLDGRLPIDKNGYYHLVLDSTRNQTIHRISGSVKNINTPVKVYWESNLYWWLAEGEVVGNITKTYFNEFTGELVYANLPPLVNWKNALVPTINLVSYSGKDGEINTVIAPIYSMKNDTLRVKSTISEWDIIQTINIVLE